MWKVSLFGVGTVLRLERDASSMVKRLRQATNEYASTPAPPSVLSVGRAEPFSYHFSKTPLSQSHQQSIVLLAGEALDLLGARKKTSKTMRGVAVSTIEENRARMRVHIGMLPARKSHRSYVMFASDASPYPSSPSSPGCFTWSVFFISPHFVIHFSEALIGPSRACRKNIASAKRGVGACTLRK